MLNYRDIANRMRSHQYRPFVNSGVWSRGWYQGPYTQFANRPHGDVAIARDGWRGAPYNYDTIWWQSILSWFTAYPAAQANNPGAIWHTATNTRIQVRNIRTILNKTTGARAVVNSVRDVPADKFTIFFDAGNTSDPGGRTESDANGNGRSYVLDTSGDFAVHGYGSFVTIDDPQNIEDITVDMEFRLILDNPAGVDDRANAKIVVVAGCDAYPYAGAPMPAVGYWPAIGASGAALATNDWQSVTFTTLFSGVTTHMGASDLAANFTDTLFVAEGVAGRMPGYTDGGSVPSDGTGGGTQPPVVTPPGTRTYRVLLLGDSMTAGDEQDFDGPNSYRSYRGPIQPLMAAAGYTVDYVGTRSSVPATGGDPDHDGYGGARFSTSDNNIANRLDAIVAAATAGGAVLDAVVLFIGWNDIYNEPTGIAARYLAFVQSLRAKLPAVPFVLTTITPQQNQTEAQTNAAVPGYAALNTQIRATPAAVTGTRVADAAAGGFVPSDYKDNIHHIAGGASKTAAIVAPQLIAALVGSAEPVPLPAAFVIPGRPYRPEVFVSLTGGEITVSGGGITPLAPSIVTTALTDGQVAQPYSVTLDITGSPAPTVTTSPSPPFPGVTLSGLTISGASLTTAGAYEFDVSAANSSGPTATRRFSVTVSAATEITTTTLASVSAGQSFTRLLSATGAAPITWAITDRGTLPAGPEIVVDTLVGTLPDAGEYSFTVAANGPGGFDIQVLSLLVTPAADNGAWIRIPRDAEVWVRVPRDES